jgi:hypothetical protein
MIQHAIEKEHKQRLSEAKRPRRRRSSDRGPGSGHGQRQRLDRQPGSRAAVVRRDPAPDGCAVTRRRMLRTGPRANLRCSTSAATRPRAGHAPLRYERPWWRRARRRGLREAAIIPFDNATRGAAGAITFLTYRGRIGAFLLRPHATNTARPPSTTFIAIPPNSARTR